MLTHDLPGWRAEEGVTVWTGPVGLLLSFIFSFSYSHMCTHMPYGEEEKERFSRIIIKQLNYRVLSKGQALV